ncbi:MAG: hypothetical protein JEY94_01695 [Melioribacteraceae bacterium]|nr:hypothetical protein [Melioribacteraceae bacterium]
MKNLPQILLIEEDFVIRKTTRFILERLGFNVIDVSSKCEANQMVDSFNETEVSRHLVVINEEQDVFNEMELLSLNYKLSGAVVNN